MEPILRYNIAYTTASGPCFPKPTLRGLIKDDSGWPYISRGVGQGCLIAMRFLSRPELAIVTLRRVDEAR